MKHALILALAFWSFAAGAEEKSKHFYGLDPDSGSLCHFYEVKLTEKDAGNAELTFALDTGSVLKKNEKAGFVADEASMRYTMKGRLEQKDGELLFVGDYPGKPWSYNYYVALDPQSKEIRRLEGFAHYRALMDILDVRQVNCRDVVGVRELGASYLSRDEALEKKFPKAKDFPNCLSVAKNVLSLKHNAYANSNSLGVVAIALGFVFPPAAAYSVPLGMMLIGANEAGGYISGDFKMLDKSAEMAQLLYQGYLHEKAGGLFSYPLTRKMANELGVKEAEVVAALKKDQKGFCFQENPEGGDPLYAPKDFAELKRYLSERIPGARVATPADAPADASADTPADSGEGFQPAF